MIVAFALLDEWMIGNLGRVYSDVLHINMLNIYITYIFIPALNSLDSKGARGGWLVC